MPRASIPKIEYLRVQNYRVLKDLELRKITFIYDQVLSEQDAHIPTKNIAITEVGASRSLLLSSLFWKYNNISARFRFSLSPVAGFD